MTIRVATAKDCEKLPIIEQAANAAFMPYFPEFMDIFTVMSASQYNNILNTGTVLIYENDQAEICGFIALDIIDNQPHIAELDVSPLHTQKGIGTALLKKAVEWASHSGYAHITLTTFSDIPFNAPFYEKNGFQKFEPQSTSLQNILIDEQNSPLQKLSPRIAMKLELKSKHSLY